MLFIIIIAGFHWVMELFEPCECCQAGCQGQPNDCYCDEYCLTLLDCCRDIYKFTSCGSSMSNKIMHDFIFVNK